MAWDRTLWCETEHHAVRQNTTVWDRTLRCETEHYGLRQNTMLWNRTLRCETEHYGVRQNTKVWGRTLRFETEHYVVRQNTKVWDRTLRFETEHYAVRQNTTVWDRTLWCETEHYGVRQNTMPVQAFEIPEMLIHNLFWCWFWSITYRYWTTVYTHFVTVPFWNSFKNTHGFMGTVRPRMAHWSADYQHEIPYQEKNVFVSTANFVTCEQCQIDNTMAVIRNVYGHLYGWVWHTETVKAACKTAFLYGPLAT